MTLPKDSKRPVYPGKGLRPTLDEVSRLMVDWNMLKIPVYKTEIVSDSSGKSDKKVKRIEIHPIEWDAKIVFSGGRMTPGLQITQVDNVSVVSRSKGVIKKKEDLIVKIVFRDNHDVVHWIVIDLEDL